MRTIEAITMALLLLPATARAQGIGDEGPKWVNVTGNVGGDTWGYAGVCKIACVPGPDRDEVIAGISERGLWSSVDGDATWRKLGAEDKVPIAHRPHQVLFDPTQPKTFWVSGCYGAGLFKTTDGGRTFLPLGKLSHLDGVAVDFTDKDRRTLLTGHHEAARSIEKSADGGRTWQPIGKNLPDKTNHSTDPIVLDANTYIVNTAGWAKGMSWGIYRTEDGGATWAKVSDLGPSGVALTAGDGTIFWQLTWGGGLISSSDKGKTWRRIPSPVKSNLIEVPAGSKLGGPAGALLGWADATLYVSRDVGKTWSKLGGPTPIKPHSLAYSQKRDCLFIARSTQGKVGDAIFRGDLGADADQGFKEQPAALPAPAGRGLRRNPTRWRR